MKSFRSMIRRLSIVAGATVVGTTALVALTTTPANATDADVVGTAVCDSTTGNWVVTWTVSSRWNPTGTLREVAWGPTGSTVTGAIANNATLVRNAPLIGTQTVPGTSSARSATLRFRTSFTNGHTSNDGGRADFGGTCEQDEPTYEATAESDCDSITVVVKNTGKIEITGTVTSGSASESFTLAPDATSEPFSFPGGSGVTATVAVQGAESETFTWKDPGDCPTPTTPPVTTTTTPPLPVTGASLTSLIGIGGALVLVGGVLLFVLRSRRRLGES